MAGPDLNVFQKQVSLIDRNRLQADFELKKQLLASQLLKASNGQQLPAPIQVANAIAAKRAAGDVQGVNDLLASAKLYDRGIVTDQLGNPVAMQGYGQAIGEIAAVKAGMTQQAKTNVDAVMQPIIARGKADQNNASDLNFAPMIAQGKAAANIVGKEQGTNQTELNTQAAILPELTKTVGELSALGKDATYTRTGQLADSIVRQTNGFGGITAPATKGAVARTEYMAKVDNQILPLLRQTFGAAFTENEGKSLRSVLGDPNKAPAEKDAALNAFIEQKRSSLQTKQREVSGQPRQGNVTIRMGQIEDGYQFIGGNPADPNSWKKVQ